MVRVVFLRHGPDHHASAMACLRERVLDPVFNGAAIDAVVVDNALPPEHVSCASEGFVLIGGDNRQREFSGWEKGLAWLAHRDFAPGDAVILVNDTFHRNYDVGYLERFGREPVPQWLEAGGLVGHVDLYPREITLFGLAMRFWLRSSFVLARWETLSRLLPLAVDCGEALAPEAAPGAIFHPDPETFFNPDGPLSPRYQEYLKSFLLGEGGEYEARWHSREDDPAKDAAAWRRLREKAACIVREHLLSARAQALGIPLCDVSGKLARRVAAMDAMAVRHAAGETHAVL